MRAMRALCFDDAHARLRSGARFYVSSARMAIAFLLFFSLLLVSLLLVMFFFLMIFDFRFDFDLIIFRFSSFCPITAIIFAFLFF